MLILSVFPGQNYCRIIADYKSIIIHILSPNVVLDLFINLSSCEHYTFWTSICYWWPVGLIDQSSYNSLLSKKKHNVWIILTITNTQMKHIVLFITNYFVSMFNKEFLLLTSLMIKDMIKSLTYSISLGHCAATEWIVSKASKMLYIPELREKFYVLLK